MSEDDVNNKAMDDQTTDLENEQNQVEDEELGEAEIEGSVTDQKPKNVGRPVKAKPKDKTINEKTIKVIVHRGNVHHNDNTFEKGDLVELSESEAERLKTLGVIRYADE